MRLQGGPDISVAPQRASQIYHETGCFQRILQVKLTRCAAYNSWSSPRQNENEGPKCGAIMMKILTSELLSFRITVACMYVGSLLPESRFGQSVARYFGYQ